MKTRVLNLEAIRDCVPRCSGIDEFIQRHGQSIEVDEDFCVKTAQHVNWLAIGLSVLSETNSKRLLTEVAEDFAARRVYGDLWGVPRHDAFDEEVIGHFRFCARMFARLFVQEKDQCES